MPVSLEDHSEAELPLKERLAAETEGESWEDTLIAQELLARLGEAFARVLDERERFILTRHYGLDGAPPHSLRQIGEALDLCGERVRQMEVFAFRQLHAAL